MKKFLTLGLVALFLASFAGAGTTNYLHEGESVGSLPVNDCSLNVLLTDLNGGANPSATYAIEYAKNASVYASVTLQEGESVSFERAYCSGSAWNAEYYPQVDLAFEMIPSSDPAAAMTAINFYQDTSYSFPYAGSGTYYLGIGEGVMASNNGNYPAIVVTDVTPFLFGPSHLPKVTIDCYDEYGLNRDTAILLPGESDYLTECGTVYVVSAGIAGSDTTFAQLTVNFETAPLPSVVPSPVPSVVPLPPVPSNESIAPIPQVQNNYSVGWNLFSVPLDGAALAYTNCLPASVWQYDAQSNSYSRAGRLSQGLRLSSGAGYWFRAAADCSAVFHGSQEYTEYYQELDAGWNLVGAPFASTDFSSVIGDCVVVSGPWSFSAFSGYAQDSFLSPGKGYWVKVSAACALGSSDKPPAMPGGD